MTEPAAPPPAPAGWYPDPQGRFARRYFDGHTWTPSVQDWSGWTGFEWQAPTPAYARPAGGGGGSPAGLILVVIGLVLAILSLFVLDWLTVEGFIGRVGRTAMDLLDSTSDSNESHAEALFGLLVLTLLVAPAVTVMSLLATWPSGYGPRIGRRVSGSILAALMIVIQFAAVVVLADAISGSGSHVGVGGPLGILAYVLILAGSVVGARRQERPASPAGQPAVSQPWPGSPAAPVVPMSPPVQPAAPQMETPQPDRLAD